MYSIMLSKAANRTLAKLPANVRRTITVKLMELANDPYAPNSNVTAMVGVAGYRLRVGDWRIVYSLDDAVRVLFVERVGSRGSIYND